MNKKTFTITPDTKEIDLTAEVYYVEDHIPDLDNFVECVELDFRINNSNSIKYYFDKHGVDYREKQFVFDHYLYYDDFKDNGYFNPSLFISDVKDFLKYEKDNNINHQFSVDDVIKKKHIPLNCLMNKGRPHREITSCWLLNNVNLKNLLYTQRCQSSNHRSSARNYIDFLDNKNSIKEYSELPKRWINFYSSLTYKDNAQRFYQYFNPKIFSKTFFSLVLEPDFLDNSCSLSEKYIYAIKGLTIPIVSGYKIYEKLEALGFHIFDDIINTDYQYEIHPVKRIWKMLESNKELMTGSIERFKNESVKQRMIENYNHVDNVDKLIYNFRYLNDR